MLTRQATGTRPLVSPSAVFSMSKSTWVSWYLAAAASIGTTLAALLYALTNRASQTEA
jgi:hypothetical protein